MGCKGDGIGCLAVVDADVGYCSLVLLLQDWSDLYGTLSKYSSLSYAVHQPGNYTFTQLGLC